MPRPEIGNEKKRSALAISSYILLSIGAFSMIIPFVWMLSTSLKGINEVFIFPPQWMPKPIRWENYARVFELMNFGRYFFNTVLVTVGRMALMFFTCTMAAYGFARLKFPGRDVLFFMLLGTLMLPIEVLMVPSFILMKNLHWINTFRALIIPQGLAAFGGAFSIFLMRQFFLTIPKELEESAIIDGAGPVRVFWSIMLPLAKPAFAALAVFAFTGAWNDFVWPLLVTNTDNMKVLSLGIAGFKGLREGLTKWPLMMAASTMTLLPVMVIFFLAQKYFIEGISITGLKE
ncbi:carbohydrate ABC transporter permease [Candidatus Bipolaricaulota bacterium]|nr:carbohydrate ABC transporter permease [Candidatus Bipolaricaulota bacterium]